MDSIPKRLSSLEREAPTQGRKKIIITHYISIVSWRVYFWAQARDGGGVKVSPNTIRPCLATKDDFGWIVMKVDL